VDVVALNVVRRTAAYSCRLRLFEGGTLTARPVVITTGVTCRRLGVPAPAVRQKALTSPAAGSASRREGRRKIIPAGAGWLAGWPFGPADPCCRATRGYRRPVLAPRAGGL
jgi:hypothetical protein